MTEGETPREPLSPRERVARIVMMLFAIYSPYSWLLFVVGDRGYRMFWIKCWPILPGLVLQFCGCGDFRDHRITAAIIGSVLFVGLVMTLVLRARVAWPIIASVFAISCVLGFGAWRLYLV